MFEVEFSSIAKKFLKKAEKEVAARVVERIEKLSEDPFPADVKRIVNRKEKVFRVRVGDYRVQYVVLHERSLILISDIDKRERAYE